MEAIKTKSVKSAATLTMLYKALYNACRSQLPPASQDDPAAVKALRDHLTNEKYGKVYDEMTKSELIALTAAINADLNNMPTGKMLGQLKFYMIAVALVYCNFKDWHYEDTETGALLSGDDLRTLLVEQFYNGSKRLPENIVRRLYNDWINPKSNSLLMEGGYKKFIANPSNLHYEKLTKEQCKYLISRYYPIYDNKINKTARPVRASLN